jgi:hypothetical protein
MVKIEVDMESVTCNQCGIIFTIPSEHKKQLLENGSTFYCPNGHSLYYPNSLNEKYNKLKVEFEKLKIEKDVTFKTLTEERAETLKLKKSIDGYKGMIGKLNSERTS